MGNRDELLLFSSANCDIILKNGNREAFVMSTVQNFRSALGGFNREDVVRYIEYINNKHNAEITQLNTQLQNARAAAAKAQPAEDNTQLREQLEAAEARCAELEKLLAEAKAGKTEKNEDELEAYRRAERAERLARDRASQIYDKANATLAEATLKVETVTEDMLGMVQQITQQAQNAKTVLQEAVSAMYAIRPEEE